MPACPYGTGPGNRSCDVTSPCDRPPPSPSVKVNVKGCTRCPCCNKSKVNLELRVADSKQGNSSTCPVACDITKQVQAITGGASGSRHPPCATKPPPCPTPFPPKQPESAACTSACRATQTKSSNNCCQTQTVIQSSSSCSTQTCPRPKPRASLCCSNKSSGGSAPMIAEYRESSSQCPNDANSLPAECCTSPSPPPPPPPPEPMRCQPSCKSEPSCCQSSCNSSSRRQNGSFESSIHLSTECCRSSSHYPRRTSFASSVPMAEECCRSSSHRRKSSLASSGCGSAECCRSPPPRLTQPCCPPSPPSCPRPSPQPCCPKRSSCCTTPPCCPPPRPSCCTPPPAPPCCQPPRLSCCKPSPRCSPPPCCPPAPSCPPKSCCPSPPLRCPPKPCCPSPPLCCPSSVCCPPKPCCPPPSRCPPSACFPLPSRCPPQRPVKCCFVESDPCQQQCCPQEISYECESTKLSKWGKEREANKRKIRSCSAINQSVCCLKPEKVCCLKPVCSQCDKCSHNCRRISETNVCDKPEGVVICSKCMRECYLKCKRVCLRHESSNCSICPPKRRRECLPEYDCKNDNFPCKDAVEKVHTKQSHTRFKMTPSRNIKTCQVTCADTGKTICECGNCDMMMTCVKNNGDWQCDCSCLNCKNKWQYIGGDHIQQSICKGQCPSNKSILKFFRQSVERPRAQSPARRCAGPPHCCDKVVSTCVKFGDAVECEATCMGCKAQWGTKWQGDCVERRLKNCSNSNLVQGDFVERRLKNGSNSNLVQGDFVERRLKNGSNSNLVQGDCVERRLKNSSNSNLVQGDCVERRLKNGSNSNLVQGDCVDRRLKNGSNSNFV